jgi:hypothetical protein
VVNKHIAFAQRFMCLVETSPYSGQGILGCGISISKICSMLFLVELKDKNLGQHGQQSSTLWLIKGLEGHLTLCFILPLTNELT